MKNPNWLSLEEVIKINEKVVERSSEPHFVRDRGLLDSALARPQNAHAYGETDTFQLAASYAEGIARNHAFGQGNKRTAFEAADIFLFRNGYNLQAEKHPEHTEMMEKLGQGHISREDAAKHFRDHSNSLRQSKQRSSSDEAPEKSIGDNPVKERSNKNTPDRSKSREGSVWNKGTDQSIWNKDKDQSVWDKGKTNKPTDPNERTPDRSQSKGHKRTPPR